MYTSKLVKQNLRHLIVISIKLTLIKDDIKPTIFKNLRKKDLGHNQAEYNFNLKFFAIDWF